MSGTLMFSKRSDNRLIAAIISTHNPVGEPDATVWDMELWGKLSRLSGASQFSGKVAVAL